MSKREKQNGGRREGGKEIGKSKRQVKKGEEKTRYGNQRDKIKTSKQDINDGKE